MRLPIAPDVEAVTSMSPSLYAAARQCLARAVWTAHGNRSAIPAHPRALLGIGVHHVLERAAVGGIEGSDVDAKRDSARSAFDEKVAALLGAAHPILAVKFGTPERLPYYNLYRERAALLAAEQVVDIPSHGQGRRTDAPGRGPAVERTLQSDEGRLRGRPDVIDASRSEVVDYKTSAPPEDGGVREREARQLRLYAHLANENGIPVAKGVIVRADRSRAEIDISAAEAKAEAAEAIIKLEEINAVVGHAFNAVASPSGPACSGCPCIPMCQRFWDAAEPDWAEEAGVHVQGTVLDVRVTGTGLVGIDLDVQQGTMPRGAGHVERLTAEWLTAGQENLPSAGDVVRVLNLYRVEDSDEPVVYRANRESTTCWRLG